ncbi:pyruvate kinase [Bacillus sp. NRRL B-14911]|uniref:Uncharacterized protein n=1 Tax=Bacillus infantis NRRL B-14911 TaxID=1367477 RepID=U5LEH6_9BACI|nr:hypothetical protein N288_19635 [Bacillus infantis NRRL B-14911]EAR64029.1 pyruvate kinase [Bacillus sp. NRRL B-14911]
MAEACEEASPPFHQGRLMIGLRSRNALDYERNGLQKQAQVQ